MKIVFICGSIENAKDGVGDYVIQFARQLIFQGHRIGIVAIKDKYVDIDIDDFIFSDEINLPILRLPAKHSFSKNAFVAKKWIERFNPEWLSLQFVTFTFHNKGLPLGIIGGLIKIGCGRKWHVMFHELWVGMNIEASLKFKCWGYFQRCIILLMLFKLKPNIVHTQSRLYQYYLNKMGIRAKYLPLFSNIPVNNFVDTALVTSVNKLSNKVSIIIFGSIHNNGGQIEKLAKEISRFGTSTNRDVSLTFLGRSNNDVKNLAKVFEDEGIFVEFLGEQSAISISKILREATIGISTTPIALAEKSGSVAAMRIHGLPVLFISGFWTPRNAPMLPLIDGVFEYSEGKFEDCLLSFKPAPILNEIEIVAKEFVNSLESHVY